MLKKLLVILFLSSFFCSLTEAGWEEAGSQYAGRSNSIAIGYRDTAHTEYIIYSADSSYGVYRLFHIDSLWKEPDTATSHATCVITPPENSDLAYVGRFDIGVHKTTNGGQTWDATGAMSTNNQVISMSFSPIDRDYKIIAGLDTFVTNLYGGECVNQYTPDGGVHWYHFPMDDDPKDGPPASVYSFVDDQTDTLQFYEASGQGNTANWGVYLVDLGTDEPQAGNFFLKLEGDARAIAGEVSADTVILYAGVYSKVGGSSEKGVWKTEGNDTSWVHLDGTTYPITTIGLDPKALDHGSLDTIYVGTDGYGIMRSLDAGSTWSFVNSGIYCKSILDIKVDPVNNNRVYAGAQWSFYVSTDYGQTWTERIQGMKKAQISGVASNTPAKYCIGEFDNLYKSTDGGSSWTTIYAFEGKPGFEGSDHIKAKLLTLGKDNPNKLFATVFVPIAEGGHFSDRILRSTDGGLSWQMVFDEGNPGTVATSVVIDPKDSSVVYATYDDFWGTYRVIKNTSGGDSSSWSPKCTGLPDSDHPLCLAVNPVYTNILFVGMNTNGVYKNIGSGDSTWTQTGLTDKKVRSIVINLSDTDELYAGTSVGVYKSTNGGGDWSLVDSGMTYKDVYSLAIKPHLNSAVYAACLDDNDSGHVYQSTDGGTSWTEIDSGLPSDWVVFADDVPYISLQTDTLPFANHVFLGTKKGLFKLQTPSYSGHVSQNANWGPGRVYVDGDVTVDSSVTLTIDSNTTILSKPNFDSQEGGSDAEKCELIVYGSLNSEGKFNDSIKFISAASAPSDSDWHGITVESGGSARLNYCDIRHAYTGVYFDNSANDTVTHCRFKNNFMHAIRTENGSLLIDSCVIENDSIGGSEETYGILCYVSSPTIKNTFVKNCKYGIKSESSKQVQASPSIEKCGFYNIGEVGIWLNGISGASLKQSCFKGSFNKACIEVYKGSPDIYECYMASVGSGIPIGILFENNAGGSLRHTTIFDYDSCAVQITQPSGGPDLGTSDSTGNNYFERTDHNYIISSSSSTIKAELNYWETEDSDSIDAKIDGNVDFSPWLDYCSPPSPYYPDICSDLPPDDPNVDPCKITVTCEEKMPKSFALSQNYPNPFNPQTMIKYDLPEPGHVRIAIYNVLGQKVRTLVDEDQEAGYKSVSWDGKDEQGKDLATGIYFYGIKAGDFSVVKKMVLLK